MFNIYADGVCIHSDVFALEHMKLISPKLTLEDCSAGSLNITVPPVNVGYSTIQKLITTITVEKDGEEIWEGRPLTENDDFWNNRVLYCEGALAYFNDSTQPPCEHAGVTVRGFLEELIDEHNSKVAPNRQFAIGVVTVADDSFPTYYTNDEKTIEVLNSLITTYGGHMRVRKENGVRYLDYLKDYPDTCSQLIQFGSNLLDFTKNWDLTEYATVILPLGARLDDSPIEALDAYVSIDSVNGGSRYLQSAEAVATYGWIEKKVTFDNVTEPSELLQKAQEYLNDIQFDSLKLELSALDLHYLDANVEAVKLLDEIRVISRPHGLDRLFPVTKLEIPLDSPEQTTFTLGDSVEVSLTSVNNQTNSEILDKIEKLPKAHSILKEAKQNATDIMHMATTGYITITQDEYGSETLYITNTRDYLTADKMWKWNMNGLGYSKDGGKTFGLAITMDGAIVADYITAGVLNGDVIRTGVIRDYNSNVVIDLVNGTLTMKKGSIDIGDGNFTVDNEGNLYARRGTFAGTLSGAKGTFGGELVAASGDFKGVVQASDFLDRNGRSMLNGDKFASDYLDLYGITITNRYTGETTFAVSSTGAITINGKVTMGAGSTINWASVSNTNLSQNPAYSLAERANSNANSAWSEAADAFDTADAAYAKAESAQNSISSLMSNQLKNITGTKITDRTIEACTILGADIYWGGTNDTYGHLTYTTGSDGVRITDLVQLYSNHGVNIEAVEGMRFHAESLWLDFHPTEVHFRDNGWKTLKQVIEQVIAEKASA